MRLLTPVILDRTAPLARANPLAKLAAGLALMATLFVSIDGVTATLVVLALVAAVAASGISPVSLLSRTWPLLLVALTVGVVNVLFAAEQVGAVAVRFGPVQLGAGTLLAGIGLGLRLVGIALAGVLAVATTEPADLADALVQQARVSPRFAIATLAAVRLIPILAEESMLIGLARRARGVQAGRSPVAWVRLVASHLFSLLVAAVRRGTRLATAMEARGFGAMPCRTVARPQRMRRADWAWVAGAILVGLSAITVSAALGAWRPLWG